MAANFKMPGTGGKRAAEIDRPWADVGPGPAACAHCLLVLSVAVLLSGCGVSNPLGRLPVSGEVTLDGEPVVLGSIQFEPQNSGGVGSGGCIDNGVFSIGEQHGLPPGRYLVRIYYPEQHAPAADIVAPPGPESITAAPAGFAVARELIPPAHNVESEQYVEVIAEGQNRFTFQIETE